MLGAESSVQGAKPLLSSPLQVTMVTLTLQMPWMTPVSVVLGVGNLVLGVLGAQYSVSAALYSGCCVLRT